ncbi:hypothetical protein G7085_00885 [Tessaracoccus sp. HDW20]|uniref:lanthionine synthetase LanC family protein n=1 Tax=Tessaracoccus coleopterorum TaxID=2714950 RepID=UPI0018D39823|nr:lanthionine synthetase LanC family protein [Tessaracoccus coleopterorum]NHB83744.1 hypothetical protein [Tessaracoccus coleopterorum]
MSGCLSPGGRVPFTATLVPGISWSEDPGGEDSFGQTRCRLLADAFTRGGPPVAAAEAAFVSAGLDPARPHLRARGERRAGALSDAAGRCAGVLAASAVTDGARVGWGTWELDSDAEPVSLNAAADRSTTATPASPGRCGCSATTPARRSRATRARVARWRSGRRAGHRASPPVDEDDRGNDLGDGLAGDLLALIRTRSDDVERVRRLVDSLARSATRLDDLVWWADPRLPGERPLCGLAHGASGVALALAEAAVAHPGVADVAAPLIAGALRWESAWHDPGLGWPDLRGDDGGHPVLWCHGAAGIGAVRLRLLELVGAGLVLDYPPTPSRPRRPRRSWPAAGSSPRRSASPGRPGWAESRRG